MTQKSNMNMKLGKLIVLDVSLFIISMAAFFYFDYFRPQSLGGGSVITKVDNEKETFAQTTEAETGTETDTNADSNVTTTKVGSYDKDGIKITVNKKEQGEGNDKITYYVADIYASKIDDVQTAFASGEYGKNIKDTIANMADENNAILAVNGDFYGNTEDGVVIRNGVLYRSNTNGADVCVLFEDGTMKTYSGAEFDADEVIKEGAWQAWNFGPALLDESGDVNTSFNTTSYLENEHPRCSIGYVEKGHYILTVVDGRNPGYSRGATLTELGEIMKSEGCKSAYNLDGGKSAAMYFNGEYVNQPSGGGREVSDIVYIG